MVSKYFTPFPCKGSLGCLCFSEDILWALSPSFTMFCDTRISSYFELTYLSIYHTHDESQQYAERMPYMNLHSQPATSPSQLSGQSILQEYRRPQVQFLSGAQVFFLTRARAYVDYIIFHFFTKLKIYHHMFTQHFAHSLLATRAREHFKLCAYLLSSQKSNYLVNLSL